MTESKPAGGRTLSIQCCRPGHVGRVPCKCGPGRYRVWVCNTQAGRASAAARWHWPCSAGACSAPTILVLLLAACFTNTALQVNNAELGRFYSGEASIGDLFKERAFFVTLVCLHLVQGLRSHVLQVWLKQGSREWQRKSEPLSCSDTSVSEQFLALHAQRSHHKLQDFDDHLNDIRRCAATATAAAVDATHCIETMCCRQWLDYKVPAISAAQ